MVSDSKSWPCARGVGDVVSGLGLETYSLSLRQIPQKGLGYCWQALLLLCCLFLPTHLILIQGLDFRKFTFSLITQFAADKLGRTLFCDSRSFGKTHVVEPTSSGSYLCLWGQLLEQVTRAKYEPKKATWKWSDTIGAVRASKEANKLKDVTSYPTFQ